MTFPKINNFHSLSLANVLEFFEDLLTINIHEFIDQKNNFFIVIIYYGTNMG